MRGTKTLTTLVGFALLGGAGCDVDRSGTSGGGPGTGGGGSGTGGVAGSGAGGQAGGTAASGGRAGTGGQIGSGGGFGSGGLGVGGSGGPGGGGGSTGSSGGAGGGASDAGSADAVLLCDGVPPPDAGCPYLTPIWTCLPIDRGDIWMYTCPDPPLPDGGVAADARQDGARAPDGNRRDGAPDAANPDVATPKGDANNASIACGNTFCTGSDYCCNANCGTCAPRGAGCTAIACDPPSTWVCNSDADCRVEADYCTGCDCRVLGIGGTLATCTGPGVQCLLDPCTSKVALCSNGQCVVADTFSI